jgi:SAM-dependent methyltransferase
MRETNDRNPQAKEMADESMVRTLAAQAEMIWPQELALFQRYSLTGPIKVLDVGCGTGEITRRLADLYPEATLIGIDIVESHLSEARQRYADYSERLSFRPGDAFHLDFPDGHFDLMVCRHMIQSVPDQQAVVRELLRVTKPGGRLHVVAEDYHMISFYPGSAGEPDPDAFWRQGPVSFGEVVGTDLRVGRRIFSMLRAEGASEIGVDYIVVDTLRVDRAVFIEMMVAWRDGFTDAITEHTELARDQVIAHFDAMIASLEDPDRYSVWHLPVWSCKR